MNSPGQCVAVIPCLNEERTIFPLVQAVQRHIPEVIVVDDGSCDGTADLAAKAGAEIIRHPQSRGKGASLNAGWQRAAECGFEWAMCLDGDGQHSPLDIPGFLSAAQTGDADLIVGNRFARAAWMPWLRRRVNDWLSRRLSRAAGISLPDSQCGFRMMRLSAWRTLSLRAEHFEIESEVLLAFAARGYELQFVPIRTIYGAERSKINPLRDSWRWFRWWRSMKTQSSQSIEEISVNAGENVLPVTAVETRERA